MPPPMVFLAWATVLVATTAVSSEVVAVDGWPPTRNRCERIEIPMCQNLGYEATVMPNLMDNRDQKQAQMELESYALLVNSRCSVHIRHFLCSIFAPFCSEQVNFPITSCRGVCLQVKKDCLPAMKLYNLDWPAHFNCSRFPEPEREPQNLCMQNLNGTEDAVEKAAAPRPPSLPLRIPAEVHFEDGAVPPRWPPFRDPKRCPPNFVKIRESLGHGCAPRCGADAHYKTEDKKFVESWFTGWAWLCFAVTLFALLTFCVDSSRFRYPERPVIFLAICGNAVAIAYMVRGSVGSKRLGCAEPTDGGEDYVPVDGLESASCTFLFLVLYYFSLASSVWFVNLTFSWYLSAAKKWSTEALENISSYFHVAAWTVPAAFTVAALVLRRVSADELTGVCQISDAAAVPFVIVPNASLLFAGFFLACLGGAALIRVRRAVKTVGGSTSKLERLMSRLIIFGSLYIIPALGTSACVLYESIHRPKWQSLSLWAAVECQHHTGCSQPLSSGLEVVLLRLFLSLAGGTATGMWVWSGKTCRVWGSLLTKAPKKPTACYRQTVVPVAFTMPKRSLYTRPMHISRV